jgi:Flp pilus assembly protein TadD
MRGLLHLGAVLLACAGTVAVTPTAAQGSYSQYNESAAAALARYIRTLASDPKDFTTLISAGRAALELGDTQAAAGFFARADDVNPHSPLPQAGMGAVSVMNSAAQASLPYFNRAEQLGATLATIGCDRGLAYDLLGRQSDAQSDYRAALSGPDRDEARRRLALSLAISGDRSGALQALAPLSAKGDTGAARTRAFVLALTGDSNAALNAINAVMPGSSGRVAPFVQRLPSLSAAQKAAAVNLGIFPDSGSSYAYAAPTPAAPTITATSGDRLAGVDSLLSNPPAQTAAQPAQSTWQQPVQVAYAAPPVPATVQRIVAPFQPKIWLQLASGSDVDALSSRFRTLRSKDRDLFDGIKPYLARGANGSLLLIGPFRGASDAQIFSEDLASIGVDASKYINSQSDRIAPLPGE